MFAAESTLAERMLALCSIDALAGSHVALVGGLFFTGLIGGALHCTPMCGPFALAQAAAQTHARGRLGRAAHASALPYHVGRLTTYAGLGALSGVFGGLAIALSGFREIAAALLMVAALVLAAQAARALGRPLPMPRFMGHLFARATLPVTRRIAPVARRLSGAPSWLRGYGLGVLLGFLPCGLLYGALLAAAASGSLIGGALVMGAFAAGTAPALGLLAATGHVAARRWPAALHRASGVALGLGAALSVAFAVEWLS